MKRGFTFVEVLTVLAATGVVSGTLYSMTRSSREAAREGTCMGHMHTIYQALVEYSADWQGPEQMPGMGEIKFVGTPQALLKYVPDKNVFYCPNTPKAMRRLAWSSYQLNFLKVRKDGSDEIKKYYEWWKTQLRTLGSKAPLVICNTHDETYWAPAEENIDPDLAKPFQIHLDLDGAVEAKRFNVRRYTTVISN